ncbi:MAG TPA: hypothetical protein VGI00_10715 [Streptosporangiaceae bacterium]
MTPGPYDLFITVGDDFLTVSILASGPVRTPVKWAGNDIACR